MAGKSRRATPQDPAQEIREATQRAIARITELKEYQDKLPQDLRGRVEENIGYLEELILPPLQRLNDRLESISGNSAINETLKKELTLDAFEKSYEDLNRYSFENMCDHIMTTLHVAPQRKATDEVTVKREGYALAEQLKADLESIKNNAKTLCTAAQKTNKIAF